MTVLLYRHRPQDAAVGRNASRQAPQAPAEQTRPTSPEQLKRGSAGDKAIALLLPQRAAITRHAWCSSISPVWSRRAEMLEFLAKQERGC